MPSVVSKIMATVNAPYGASITPEQLTARITDPASAATFDAATFAFFSDVSPKLQMQFIAEMGADVDKVALVARQFSVLAGYKLALGS